VSLAERVVEVALSQLGVREDEEPNSGEPSRLYMAGRREPWCGHFVVFCFRRAGRPLPGDVVPTLRRGNPLAGVQCLENMLRMQGWRVLQPAPGDIVCFVGRGASDRGPGRHVGIVVEVACHYIRTVEGNVGDSVRRVQYRRTTLDTLVTSFCRVPGEGSK
jgi:hypothetical protein